jgi:TetR/AcrR family transcriptional repressor of nem operon
MGIGRQSLYDTFGDKRSLYLEALKRYFEQRATMVRDTLSQPGSPLGNLAQLFELMMKRSEDAGFCGCFIGNTLAEFGDRDPEIAGILNHHLERVRSAFEDTFQRAQDEGELAPTASPKDLADILLVTTQGLALVSKIRPNRELARNAAEKSLGLISAAYSTRNPH